MKNILEYINDIEREREDKYIKLNKDDIYYRGFPIGHNIKRRSLSKEDEEIIDELSSIFNSPEFEEYSKQLQKFLEDGVKSNKIKKIDYDIFCHRFGIFGYEAINPKELLKKFNLSYPSSVNNSIDIIRKFLNSNTLSKKIMNEIKDLIKENLKDE